MPHDARRSSPVPLIALALVVLSAALVGSKLGLGAALLLLAGASLVLAIALLWSSVQSLTGDAPMTLEEALRLGAPSAEDERKQAVLRALKDLQYERSVGKLSEDDYALLSARYSQEAKELLRSLDESRSAERARIEAELAQRLGGVTDASPRKPNKKKKRRSVGPASTGDATTGDATTGTATASGTGAVSPPTGDEPDSRAEASDGAATDAASPDELEANTRTTEQRGQS